MTKQTGFLFAALAATVLAASFFSAPVETEKTPAPALKKGQAPGNRSLSKPEIERIVRSYILKNPKIISEAMQALQARREKERRASTRSAIDKNQSAIFRDKEAPVGGNPRGDVTIVEFFDYRCSFCRRVAPVVKKVMKNDPNIRLVYKEFPILGPSSTLAARAALASRAQGKYLPFHKALMEAKISFDEASIMAVAASVGIDTARLKKDMRAPGIGAHIQKNHELARKLLIRGTPAFIVGNRLFPGALSEAQLLHLIDQARKKS